jgi:hypothetical protein
MIQGIAIGHGISHIFGQTDASGGPVTGGFIELEGSITDMILMESGDFILQE